MKNLASYLKRFTLLVPKNKTVREALAKVLDDMNLPKNSISSTYKDGVVFLKGNGVVRNEILIKEKEVLKKLNSELERVNIKVSKIF